MTESAQTVLYTLSGPTHFEDAGHNVVTPAVADRDTMGVWVMWVHANGGDYPTLADFRDYKEMDGWESEIAFEVYDA